MAPDPSPGTCGGVFLPLRVGHRQPLSHGTAAAAGWAPRRLWVPFCSVRLIRPAAPPRFVQLNPAAGRSHRVPAQPRGPGGSVPPRREGTEL